MHLGRRAELNQPPLVQHQHQISNIHTEMAVSGSEGGNPTHRGSNEVHDLFPVYNIKARGDLVQQQHPRLTNKGSGYRQPLSLTTRKRIR